MKAIPAHLLAKLQKRVKQIRNICILAHVDHGKTTLADTLVASNGIISQKMAGKLRYMDSLEEEQLRGITMKSSAISLYFTTDGEHYLINLIDSPGHIDFASEVSTAVRLCDGAIIVIDAVEGVSPQTHAVLRQAWLENIRPVLLFNKVDRLITELKLTSSESYTHLQQLLEQVNAVMAQLITGEILRKYAAKEEEVEDKQTENKTFNWDSGVHADENDDEHLYFSPAAGNVIFGSALDGWGFGIGDFAEMYSKKLGLNKSVLMKTLWGDFFFNSKSKKVSRGAQNAGKNTLFVQLILDSIWKVYKACLEEPRDMTQLDKLTTALSIKIPARELRGSDSQQVTKAIMSQWLPISTAMLGMVVEQTPSPVDMTEERVEALMCDHSVNFNSLHEQTRRLKHKFLECSSADEEPVIVYVSKMCPVEMKAFPEHQQSVPSREDLEERKEIARRRHQQRMAERANQNASEQKPAAEEQTDSANREVIEEADIAEEGEDNKGEPSFRLVAFARIFSGKIRKGQKLYVLGPKHNPAEAIEQGLADRLGEDQSLTVDTLTADLHMTQVTVSDLYTFMGRELEAMEGVPAGNILGIGGLEEHVLKSATLSSDVACPSFSAMKSEAQPIVRVAVEPVHPGDMEKLVLGMRLLNQADSCVQVMVQETGEHVLVTAGEVHLQRCCDDLRKRYCGVAINVSEPIVPFRETIVEPPKLDMVNEAIEGENVVIKQINKDSGDKVITMTKSNMTISVEAVPLPTAVTSLLDSHDKLLQAFDHHLSQSMGGRLSKYDRQTSLNDQSREQLSLLRQKMEQLLSECAELKSLADKIWSFGPRKYGPNLLINGVQGYNRPSIWDMLDSTGDGSSVRDFDSSIVNGFQLATLTGPLCDEPMMGVAFVIRKWEMTSLPAFNPADLTEDDETGSETESIKSGSTSQLSGSKRSVQTFGAHSGQIISTVKEACRKAFQSKPQRLMCAMYSCVIQATASVLGKMYGVIGKRNGKVLSEDMQEGTQVFHIAAALPVAESFGFCDEIRKRTSGLASPQLAFSHWEVIDVDPYWEPCTEEEMAHFGEKYDSQNRAKMYMTQVRKRKGLKTEEKIVMHAEKQRTLGKKK